MNRGKSDEWDSLSAKQAVWYSKDSVVNQWPKCEDMEAGTKICTFGFCGSWVRNWLNCARGCMLRGVVSCNSLPKNIFIIRLRLSQNPHSIGESGGNDTQCRKLLCWSNKQGSRLIPRACHALWGCGINLKPRFFLPTEFTVKSA